MPKKTCKLLQSRVEESFYDRACEYAKKRGLGQAALVRRAIEDMMTRDRDQEALIASLGRVAKEVRGIRSVLAMIFALQRETVREVFIRIREPQGEALQDALNRLDAQERKLLANVVKEYQGGELKRMIDAE